MLLNQIYKTPFHLKFYVRLAGQISRFKYINEIGEFIKEREDILYKIKNIGSIERKKYYLNMVENIQRDKIKKLGWTLNNMSIAKIKLNMKYEKKK
jgi:hypothetical protein